MAAFGLHEWEQTRQPTFPSRLPLLQLDHVFCARFASGGAGRAAWSDLGRMSDHLPLIAEFEFAQGMA